MITPMKKTLLYLICFLICGGAFALHAQPIDLTTQLTKFLVDLRAGTLGVANPITSIAVADGTAGAPPFSFLSEPTLGLRRSSAAVITLQGSMTATSNLTATGNVLSGASFIVPGAGAWLGSADGVWVLRNNGNTIGSELKVDALPTVGSGFGTSPSVTAGSTPFAGSVNVGTGGAATSGVITWGGTAFPSSPFCDYSTTTTNAVTRGTPTTTQLTLNSTTAWTASDIVSWICVSSK